MKPTLLTMQAFGPFATREVVDFTALGNNPLFLINGPTGSGKTSILDAICFALYGETTGNERQGMQMRCDQAAIDLPTEVSLEFSLNSRCYRVTRSPEQEAPKARGEGTTTRKHSAALYDITDGENLITSKTVQVKSEVANLLGLNETQFRQVMVLPQGKFRELLLASSKDREAIFGQLFQTDIYKKIEFALKDKASAISKAKDEFDNQIRGALQVAEVTTEQELAQRQLELSAELEQAQQLELTEQEKLNQAKTELHKAQDLEQQFVKLDATNAALVSHEANKVSIDQLSNQLDLAGKAAKLELPYANLQSINKQVSEFEQKLSLIQTQLNEAQSAQKQQQVELEQAQKNADAIPKLNEAQFELEQTKLKLAEKAALDSQLKKLDTTRAELAQKLVQYNAHKDKLATEAEVAAKSLEQARKDVSERAALETELVTKQHLLTNLTKYHGLKAELERLAALSDQHLSAVSNAKELLDERQKAADQLELSWHNAQASILAQKLEKDQPCPVCGSCQHPAPATLNSDSVSKEQVQSARQQERHALEQFNLASNAQQQHLNSIEQQNKLVAEAVNELADKVTIDPALLGQEIQGMSQRLTQLSAIDLVKMEHAVGELNQRCVVGDSKIHQLKTEISANDSALKMQQQQVDKVSNLIDPKYTSVDIVEQQYQVNQQTITQLKQALEAAQAASQQVNMRLVELQSQSETNKQLKVDASQQQELTLKTWQTELLSSGFESEQSFVASRADEQQVKQWQASISEYEQTKVKLQQTISDLKQQLADTDKPDLALKQTLLSEVEGRYQQLRASLDGIRSVFQRIEKVQQDIAILHDKNSQLEAEYKVFGTLYDVASGKTGSRVSLHRFVLGVLLDDVLIQASQRLNIMSKGRYQLVRKTEGFKGAAGRGLDLNVEDGYTGKNRDVATLSGGESFMAALALALGLSDVVQSYSGGIRLDTLFIDEGFGSLDPESLDLAIQTLVDLQQAGRMIGLISHVSELKEQIAQRIDVVASRVGSSISLVVT
ncbi:SMC family ATPase [Vibrio brasiliensis]|uniref:SbcC/MukB-like Walker B domain-containing protein n=1 Tax=Vibrio brasiliensis TaxID=170652 RepID=UPI001EFEAE31|nr:SMC family ATPase [Vibrio brasiliensis]MCG9782969.1 SMC family ATPase [Vibrio brasiliensis]